MEFAIIIAIERTMGKRLPKKELLEEIAREREILDTALGDLTAEQMQTPGVTPGGWSVKDILAHLIGWQRMNFDWYEHGARGEDQQMPAPGFTWKDVKALNQAIYEEHRDRNVKDILDAYKAYHQKIVSLVENLTDKELTTLNYYSWTGPSWTLSDYIRANTAAHYKWAYKHIKRWAKSQKEPIMPPLFCRLPTAK